VVDVVPTAAGGVGECAGVLTGVATGDEDVGLEGAGAGAGTGAPPEPPGQNVIRRFTSLSWHATCT